MRFFNLSSAVSCACLSACFSSVDSNVPDGLSVSASALTVTAAGDWLAFRVGARGIFRVDANLVAGTRYTLTWTDHYGAPRGRRVPDCTTDVRVIDERGVAVTLVAHNSARGANGLDPDPVTFVAPLSGRVTFEWRELDGRGDTFEASLESAEASPTSPSSPPTLSPPRGLVVHESGEVARDVAPSVEQAVLLAGGGKDNDAAMRALLAKGGFGDVVVLRMDDTGGAYADYLLGLGAHAVRELAFDALHGNTDIEGADLALVRARADDPWVSEVIDRAEVVFVAGGNQTKYVDAWKDTRLAAAVTRLASERRGAIGGTSAGMHVMGGLVHTPRGGGNSVTSEVALKDPYVKQGELAGTASLEFDESPFAIPGMKDILTDTHWSQRGRLGRSVVFQARALTDGIRSLGSLWLIACDEGTAALVDTHGVVRVFGPSTPAGGVASFFHPDTRPERCEDNQALEWRTGVPTVRVEGNADGSATFNLQAASQPRATFRSVVENGHIRR